MQDRIIKWAPFNSVINNISIINELNKKREKTIKPILSDDQIELLNEKIFESYINHLNIILFIYKNEKIIKLNGYINNINKYKKCITFNKNYIYFNQILKIDIIY